MTPEASGLQAWAGDTPVSLAEARLEASSRFAGHGPEQLTLDDPHAEGEAPAALSVEQLKKVRSLLEIGGRRLDLGVTLYAHQLVPRIRPHLELCDVIGLWVWEARDLEQLEAHFAKVKALAPGKRIRLGCYMWDFGNKKPIPLPALQKQCEFGLAQLRQGHIEGMIFLGTNICDLDLETVEWTRQWIAQVGDQVI